ncbi:MAG: hypothetical protein JWM78_869 [Verrucomicrobiaceae bacterium]|nr:hypothetical protein [Verrucomicrobiaceae bacterium]
MVRKKLAMAILALSALQANFANALGLGNLSIKSALNQPLNAEIKLLDTGDLDPTQVKIQLAAQDDFQRSGVDRDYFLTNLRFNVAMDGHGGGSIHITTKEPVVEPYLNFVIEARWPNGRLLREFAVLLDPPTFSANKGASPVAPAVSAAQPAKKSALQPPSVTPEAAAPTKSAPETSMALPATNKSGEYRVQVYDTLSKIAARYKPADDVSTAQTMLAIQRSNPDAFINNNINLIKSGAVVRLPTADEARAIPSAQAAQDADDQTHAWRGGGARTASTAAPAATGPQLDASAPEPSKAEGGFREKARLSIAAPGGSEKASAGEGAAGGKGSEALRNQLTASQEALEKGKRDNREMQSRLDDMERQIATLQRLISLKDDQLAAIQTKSAADKSAPATKPAEAIAAAPAAVAPSQPAPAPETSPATTPVAPTAESTVAPTPVAQPATDVAAKPVSVPVVTTKPATKPAPEPSLIDQLTGNPLYLAGGAAALLLLIGAAFWKRRKDAEEEAEHEDFTLDDGAAFQFAATELDETVVNQDPAIADTPDHLFEAEAVAAEEPKKTVRPETGDAIAESDIYIAYGRYQQAVDLLSTAIDHEPNRTDLRVKLLEVYVEMRNKEAFRQQFTALQALGDSNAVAQVKDVLSSVDGVSDWLDDLPSSNSAFNTATAFAAGAAASAAVSDFPHNFEQTNTPPADELDGELEQKTDDDLELDLDFDAADELAISDAEELTPLADLDPPLSESFAAPTTPVFESNFDLPAELETANSELEFNLDLDSDTAASSTQELSDLTFDFDSTPPAAAPATNFNFDSVATADDEGLELDLGDDDLDDILGEFNEADGLSDLEDLAPSAPAVNFNLPPQEQPEDLDFGAEFDLSNASEDLSISPVAEIDQFAGFEAPQSPVPDFNNTFIAEDFNTLAPEAEPEPEVAFDLQPEPEPLSLPEAAPEPEPLTEPAFTPAPVAEQSFDGGDDFDFLSDSDEVATKLDLARAYIDMGDTDGARDILDEVLQEGTDEQKQDASTLLTRIG